MVVITVNCSFHFRFTLGLVIICDAKPIIWLKFKKTFFDPQANVMKTNCDRKFFTLWLRNISKRSVAKSIKKFNYWWKQNLVCLQCSVFTRDNIFILIFLTNFSVFYKSPRVQTRQLFTVFFIRTYLYN